MATVHCPNCRTVASPEDEACPACGFVLAAPAARPPAAVPNQGNGAAARRAPVLPWPRRGGHSDGEPRGHAFPLAGGPGHAAFHPADAFGHRRALLHRLQAGQQDEHKALAQIAQAARSCKRDLLLRLSHWLLALPANGPPAAARAEMEKVSGVPLSDWETLQRAAEDLERQLKDARAEEQRAQREYEATAPLGRVSGWFVQGAPKAHIEDLRSKHRQAVAARERLEAEARQNTARRQALGERFLRGCLRDLNALSRTQAVGHDVTHRLHQLSQEASRLWNAHAAAQRRAADEMARHVEALRRDYDGSEAPDDRRP